MAGNHVQEGAVMPHVNAGEATIPSGAVVKVGSRIGVALGDIAVGAEGRLAMGEVWELPKKASDDMSAVGTEVYWDSAAGNVTLTTSQTADIWAGYVFRPAGAGEETVEIKINA